MKKSLLKFAALFFVATLFTFTSCKKGDADSQSAEDSARGSYIMADVFAMSNSGSKKESLKDFEDTGCYSVETFLDGGGFTMVFNSCTESSTGAYYNGSIKVTAAASAWESGATAGITMEFVDYTNGKEKISGKITAQVGASLLSFSFTLGAENLVITYSDGRSTKIIDSNLTLSISILSILDGFVITGSSTGINRDGVSYTSETEDVKMGFNSCGWPTEGIITMDIDGDKDIVLDFNQDGNGGCDNIIKVHQRRHDDTEISLDFSGN